jgi:hypothetical protein
MVQVWGWQFEGVASDEDAVQGEGGRIVGGEPFCRPCGTQDYGGPGDPAANRHLPSLRDSRLRRTRQPSDKSLGYFLSPLRVGVIPDHGLRRTSQWQIIGLFSLALAGCDRHRASQRRTAICRPCGTQDYGGRGNPAINRWAIFSHPCGLGPFQVTTLANDGPTSPNRLLRKRRRGEDFVGRVPRVASGGPPYPGLFSSTPVGFVRMRPASGAGCPAACESAVVAL